MTQINMSTISLSNVKDANLSKFVNDVTDLIRQETHQTLSLQMDSPSKSIPKLRYRNQEFDSVGTIIANYVNKQPVAKKRIIFRNISKPKITDPIRTFRNINIPSPVLHFDTNKHIIERVDIKQDFSYLKDDKAVSKFTSSAMSLIEQHSFPIRFNGPIILNGHLFPFPPLHIDPTHLGGNGGNTGEDTSPPDPQPVYNKFLNLEVMEVKCLEETDEWGADEIAMGGAATNDKKETIKINEFEVYDDFHTNRTKRYTPPKSIVQFPLDGDYSTKLTDEISGKLFTAMISLAEKDEGGFGNYLNHLYDAIKIQVTAILTAVSATLGAKIGAAIGGSLGTTLAGPIGTLIGIVAGLILGAVIGLIVGALQDDIFEPQMISLSLPAPDASFHGSLISPTFTLNYQDHGGNYNASFRWRLVQ